MAVAVCDLWRATRSPQRSYRSGFGSEPARVARCVEVRIAKPCGRKSGLRIELSLGKPTLSGVIIIGRIFDYLPVDFFGGCRTNVLAILRSIRDGDANDWPSLCRSFNVPVSHQHSGTHRNILLHRLGDLTALGFVEVDHWPNRNKPPVGEIRIGDSWAAVQGALGISLTDLIRLSTGDAMIVRSFHGKPSDRFYPDIFVIMPFDDDLNEVYDKHIKKVVRSLRVPLTRGALPSDSERKTRRGLLSVRRADDFFASTAIISDVWSAICAAKVVIADCSRRNANVFYELGMAHAVGTPVILTTQDRVDVPFDISHVRYIRYEPTANGMEAFEIALRRTLQELFVTNP